MFNLDFEIPNHIRITARTKYRVVWIEGFPGDKTQLGECDFEHKQIILKLGMKKEVSYWVFFHEVLHALSHHYDCSLTETQVNLIEVAFSKILKLNK